MSWFDDPESESADESVSDDRDLKALREKVLVQPKRDVQSILDQLDTLRSYIDRGHKVAYELEDRLGYVMTPPRSDGMAADSTMDDDASPLSNQLAHLISMQRTLNSRLEDLIPRLQF